MCQIAAGDCEEAIQRLFFTIARGISCQYFPKKFFDLPMVCESFVKKSTGNAARN